MLNYFLGLIFLLTVAVTPVLAQNETAPGSGGVNNESTIQTPQTGTTAQDNGIQDWWWLLPLLAIPIIYLLVSRRTDDEEETRTQTRSQYSVGAKGGRARRTENDEEEEVI